MPADSDHRAFEEAALWASADPVTSTGRGHLVLSGPRKS